jgi:hypothetical protein
MAVSNRVAGWADTRLMVFESLIGDEDPVQWGDVRLICDWRGCCHGADVAGLAAVHGAAATAGSATASSESRVIVSRYP